MAVAVVAVVGGPSIADSVSSAYGKTLTTEGLAFLVQLLRERLPAQAAYDVTRWKNVLLGMLFFRLSKRRPESIKKMLLDGVRKQLGEPFCVLCGPGPMPDLEDHGMEPGQRRDFGGGFVRLLPGLCERRLCKG